MMSRVPCVDLHAAEMPAGSIKPEEFPWHGNTVASGTTTIIKDVIMRCQQRGRITQLRTSQMTVLELNDGGAKTTE
jgi:hypothetical protein